MKRLFDSGRAPQVENCCPGAYYGKPVSGEGQWAEEEGCLVAAAPEQWLRRESGHTCILWFLLLREGVVLGS